ncbi:hypothetical protein C8Q72DRAFT_782414 [Fomitopsis betulina]|nr:hypothetical protein C8Q72DRAFT_782414 [Fomitopsis betulina]
MHLALSYKPSLPEAWEPPRIEYSGGSLRVRWARSSWVNVLRIYHCWIVYASSRHRAMIAVAPAVLWLACVTCATMIVYYLSTLHVDLPIPEIPELQPFLYTFYITTLLLNLFTTGFVCLGCIILKLWTVHKCTASAFSPRSARVLRRMSFKDMILVIVESALLHTVTVALCIILDLARTNVYYGITGISLEVAGISFDLIIIRIWTGVSAEQTLAFAAADSVAPRRPTLEIKPMRPGSVHSGLTDLNVLELQVVMSPGWKAKSGEQA